MDKLVRQHAERNIAIHLVKQSALRHAAVVRFVMLKPEVRGVIAERQKEVIMRVVCRAKQRDRFRNDALERRREFRTDGQIG